MAKTLQELLAEVKTWGQTVSLDKTPRGISLPEPLPEFPLDRPLAATHQAALVNLIDKRWLLSRNWQEQQWRAKGDGAHPDLLEFEYRFVDRMARLGVPMFATEIIRTRARQQQLYDEGFSKDSPADGLWPHNGCAADIVHATKGWALQPKEWDLIGHVGKELADARGLKITWGGDWKRFPDPAHWEVSGWKAVMSHYPWSTKRVGSFVKLLGR